MTKTSFSNSRSKVEKRYISTVYPGSFNSLFDPGARDNCTEPFILLREECRKTGYLLEAADLKTLNDCDWLLFWDLPSLTYWNGPKGLLRCFRSGLPIRTMSWLAEAKRSGNSRLALFLWEPPSTCPENQKYNFSIYNQFSAVLSWNDDLADGSHIHKFCLPIPVHFPPVEKVKFSSKKLLVNITSNKYSTYPGELYSARRDAIRYFEGARPDDFDLYGVGWDDPEGHLRCRWWLPNLNFKRPPYISYRGIVKHKWDVYPKYKFALCYENFSNQPGLITEKIFDCMRAGCVPIYLGAPNISDYVDPEAFVDRRAFEDNNALEEFICNISERQYGMFCEAIATYLKSERFKAFLSPAFAQKVIQVLDIGPPA